MPDAAPAEAAGASDAPFAAFGFHTPFDAQVDFLRNKLRLPTERWDDITKSAHDRAFIVAGAAKADLLQDLHDAVTKAAEQGTGVAQFTRDFRSIVAKHGWTGWTGEGTKAGEAWRARVIYQTNMATSYAAGRYKQLTEPATLAELPYWRYIHSDAVMHPRPWHLAWHGLTLPHDHQFWQTNMPPNGWGCQCRITAVTAREGQASAKAGLGEPPVGWNAIDPRTGTQVGIDKGWDYQPGANVGTPWHKLINEKLINLAAPIGAKMWEELAPLLQDERLKAWQSLFDATRESMLGTGTAATVHTIEATVVDALAVRGITLDNSAVWMRDTELLHALRDSKSARGANLPDEVWRNLPELLRQAKPYLDTLDHALVYEIDLGERAGKVVIRVNYNEKGRFDGVRARIVSNFVQTGGLVQRQNLQADMRYQRLE